MNSAIQLLNHQFAKIELYPTDADSPQGPLEGTHTLSTRRSHNEDDSLWMAKLSLNFNHSDPGNPAPYTGSIDVVGTFKLHPDFPEDQRVKMVSMNAGAILYGAIRELVLNLTARSLHGMMNIPTIDARSFLPKDTKSETADGKHQTNAPKEK